MIYTQEQQEAISKAIEFIRSGNPSEFFLIDGKAGTGKTTVAAAIVKAFPYKQTAVAALSHKAKYVILDKFNQEKVTATFYSIASLLGIKYDHETGTFSARSRRIPILEKDLIIIDEASMINEEALALIMNEKPKNAKVLFLGDIGQLPPIRTIQNPYYQGKTELLNKKSPVFDTPNRATLYTRIRQGEDSPILPYADYFWENSVLRPTPVLDPSPVDCTSVTRKGALLFASSTLEIANHVIDAFDYAVKNCNPNHIKIIAYRNSMREALNAKIHERIFPGNKFFSVGDLVIFNERYKDLENATEGQIDAISKVEVDQHGVRYVNMAIRIPGIPDPFSVDVCLPDYRKAYQRNISNKFTKARTMKNSPQLSLNGPTYEQLLDEAIEYKERYANLDFGYAITSHKSQGSTYDIVVIMKDDIMGVYPLGNKEKSESIYTALTRARNVAVIVEKKSGKSKEFEEISGLHELSLEIDQTKYEPDLHTSESSPQP
jgi:exodeoxyribonuclease-5